MTICPQCGTENVAEAKFCSKCGRDISVAPQQPQQQSAQPPVRSARPAKFVRCSDNKQIGGVCSGVAKYFDIDLSLVRVLAIIGLLFGSITFWLYIILWIVMPEEQCGQLA